MSALLDISRIDAGAMKPASVPFQLRDLMRKIEVEFGPMARARGLKRVLTLTRAAGLFERLGFERDAVTNFPVKVWRDCAPCPFQDRCDEIALVYELE